MPPLSHEVIQQALADHAYLAYQAGSDLGGFLPASVGHFALSGGSGRSMVGTTHTSQIPQFGQAAGGDVKTFAFTGPTTTPPDNGTNPVGGITPPPITQPSNTNTQPPPNQGFGGNPTTTTTTPETTTGEASTTGPTTSVTATTTATITTGPTTTTRPGTTTSATTTLATTTTATTTVAETTTAATTTTATGSPSPGTCGTPGLSIVSNLADCRIYAINLKPGDATSERMTITNTSDQSFDLFLKATGVQNRLWDDLQMGVWPVNTAAPSPLPSLLLWTTQYNRVTTLGVGESVTYNIELYLPPSAGNADQGLTAVIDFNWRATA
jgi:hypothetical protein